MSGDDEPYLTGVLRVIAEVAGWNVACKVADLHGGRRVYFPHHPKPGHWLVDAVGMESARAICERLTGGRGTVVLVPLGPSASRAQRWRAIAAMIADGLTNLEIARALGVHPRTVQRHRTGRSGQAAVRQPDLFGHP